MDETNVLTNRLFRAIKILSNKEGNIMDFLKLVQENWAQIVELFDKLYKMVKEKVLELAK